MKQIKKIKRGWKLLSILPLGGLLAVSIGFAGTAYAGPGIQINPKVFQPHVNIPVTRQTVRIKYPPDLQVRMWLDQGSIRKSNPRCAQGCSYDFTIRGSVKNVGRGAFIPKSPNAQALNLYGPSPTGASRSQQIQSWPFGRLNPGQAKNVSVHVQRQPGPSIEFAADYKMNIVFGPDSPGDRNRRNNQATLRRSAVVTAMNHIITVNTAVVQRFTGTRPRIPVTHGFPRGKKPDLISLVRGSNPFAGTFKVKNQGGATAGASKLMVNCKKVGHRGPGGGCPDSPALNRFSDPSLEGLVVSVPPLHAGQVYTARLPVGGLRWARGKYRFTITADATRAVTESNERNNIKSMVRRKSGFLRR